MRLTLVSPAPAAAPTLVTVDMQKQPMMMLNPTKSSGPEYTRPARTLLALNCSSA